MKRGKFKPCPFCASTQSEVQGIAGKCVLVICKRCLAAGPMAAIYRDDASNEKATEKARTKWNRRKSTETPQ